MTDIIKVIKIDKPPKFEFGAVVATPAFMDKVTPDYAFAALARHIVGDWGLCDEQDWARNEHALQHGERLLSVYPLPHEGGGFWIITEHDRSVTTLLLPEDY